jgi:HK97 family phage major capsid protein
MNDFAEVITKNEGRTLADVNKAWAEHLAAKGITNPELLYPEPVVQAIKDRFEDSGTIFATFNKHYGFTVWSNLLNIATGDATRAHQHKPGKDKQEQTITLEEKVARADFVYKYITLDKKTIREAQASGAALLQYILTELPQRIVWEIERAAIIGDGRAADAEGKVTSFEAIVDAKAPYMTATVGTNNLFDDITLAGADILAPGAQYMVMAKKALARLKIAKDKASGALLYPVGTDFAALFGVEKIFTPDWFVDSTATGDPLAVIWAGDAYDFVGDETIESFDNFILKSNKNEYLAELYCGGALLTPDSAAVITVPPAA